MATCINIDRRVTRSARTSRPGDRRCLTRQMGDNWVSTIIRSREDPWAGGYASGEFAVMQSADDLQPASSAPGLDILNSSACPGLAPGAALSCPLRGLGFWCTDNRWITRRPASGWEKQ